MGASDIISQAASDIAQEWDDATYRPMSGTSLADVSCKAWVHKILQMQPAGLDAQAWEQGIAITALYSQVGRPKRGDLFIVGSSTYEVLSVDEWDKNTIKATVREV